MLPASTCLGNRMRTRHISAGEPRRIFMGRSEVKKCYWKFSPRPVICSAKRDQNFFSESQMSGAGIPALQIINSLHSALAPRLTYRISA